MVGMPCVSSYVGGVPEYLIHSENGFLYRFEEYEVAAYYIEKLFEDAALAKKFSERSRTDMMKLHSNNDVFKKITDIYESILNER